MKKFLALILCLAMCVSLFAGFAVADQKTPYKLVCIGDSTSQGYLLDDYVDEKYGAYDNSSKSSYPFLLQKYIQEKLGESYDVQLRNMTFTGMRTDELRAMLDPSFITDVAAKKNAGLGDKFLQNHVPGYNEFFINNHADPYYSGYMDFTADDVENKAGGDAWTDDWTKAGSWANTAFTASVADADTITLDITMNNFGTYLTERLMAMFDEENGKYYSESIDELGPGFDPSKINDAKSKILSLVDKYLGNLPLPDGMLDKLIDLFVYCYCDFCVNFEANIKLIREINQKDAKILVFGAYNGMDGLVCKVGDFDVDFGALWGAYMGLVNTFVTSTCSEKTEYVYVDCSEGVQVFTGGIVKDDIYPSYMTNMITGDSGVVSSVRTIARDLVKGVQSAMIGVAQLSRLLLAPTQNADLAAGMDYCGYSFDYLDGQASVVTVSAAPPLDADNLDDYVKAYEVILYNKDAITAVAPLADVELPENTFELLAMAAGYFPYLKNALIMALANEDYEDPNPGYKAAQERLIAAANFSPLDLLGVFSALGGDMQTAMVSALFGEELTDADYTLLHVYVRFLSYRGVGTHPDDVGCQQKADYVCAAFDKTDTADKDSGTATKELATNVLKAAWTSFKDPILNAIKGIFADITENFQNFFKSIFGAYC